jgi:hypothetical protein
MASWLKVVPPAVEVVCEVEVDVLVPVEVVPAVTVLVDVTVTVVGEVTVIIEVVVRVDVTVLVVVEVTIEDEQAARLMTMPRLRARDNNFIATSNYPSFAGQEL